MILKIKSVVFLLFLTFFTLHLKAENSVEWNVKQTPPQIDTATFAAGCFWATEAAFEQIEGVQDVVSGYAGGNEKDADYRTVETGRTGHAESVNVIYDPAKISYSKLLGIFFTAHDAIQKNRQGPDIGSQYRSVIFYRNQNQKQLAEQKIKELNASGKFNEPVATEVSKLNGFYKAEDYHQDYVKNHPDEIYIQEVSMPKINKVRHQFPELLDDSNRG